MLSLQEISDRLEIQQKMTDYSAAIDHKDYDALDAVFTPEAYIDYRPMGGVDGQFPQVKAWLRDTLAKFPHYQHLIGNIEFKLEGDKARTRTICFNPMSIPLPDGKSHTMFFGLWYLDQWVRTPQGWRMTERIEEKCFDYNMPAGISAGPKPA